MTRRITGIVLGCVVMTALGSSSAEAKPAAPDEAMLTIRSSPNAGYERRIELSGSWGQTIRDAEPLAARTEPVSDRYLSVGNRTYIIDEAYNLYDSSRSLLLMPPLPAKRKLAAAAAEAAASHYGTLARWEEAGKVIGMKAIFTVVDLETGLSFRAQRRAGSTHADAQPLTREDTAVMKRIYEGRWTWKRRAILVQRDGQTLAASMHGMPHGGDGIPGNGFSGHFCIHFLGSRTHGSGQVDPDHQAMIHKAAGLLRHYAGGLSPVRMAELYLSAVNQKDPEIAAALFQDRKLALRYVKRDLETIRAVRAVEGEPVAVSADDDSLTRDVSMYVNVDGSGGSKHHVRITFEFVREGLLEPWKINAIQMK